MDWRHIGALIEVGRELYGDMLNIVAWVKSNAGQGSFYRASMNSLASSGSATSRTATMSSSDALDATGRTSGATRALTRSAKDIFDLANIAERNSPDLAYFGHWPYQYNKT